MQHTAMPSSSASPASSHLASLLRLLAPARLRESCAIAPLPSLRNAAVVGLQAGLAVLIAAAATHLSPWAHLVGYAALGALAALLGRFAPVGQRMPAVLLAGALLVGAVALMSLLGLAGATPAALLLCLGLLAGAVSWLAGRWRLGPPGAVIFVFAGCAAMVPVDGGLAAGARLLFTLAGVATALAVCRATDRLRSAPSAPPAAPALQAPWLAFARIALCTASAGLLALAAGWQHPAWAAIGAMAVLQGGPLHAAMHRAVQRTIGTLAGAALAWMILAQHPSFWPLLLAVIVLQLATEVVIGANYALGQVFVTPMALLMTSLAAPAASSGMPLARVLDTVLGALVGMAFAVVFSTLEDRVHLAQHHKRAQSA
ncbi:FUSC family protein [Acidovorax sp. LjRoot118]|uniref:FUSC family protein n=1 Tax=Acidovorax sp. LjRoot118 TaxID=3342256 RepID=UPI003ECF5447